MTVEIFLNCTSSKRIIMCFLKSAYAVRSPRSGRKTSRLIKLFQNGKRFRCLCIRIRSPVRRRENQYDHHAFLEMSFRRSRTSLKSRRPRPHEDARYTAYTINIKHINTSIIVPSSVVHNVLDVFSYGVKTCVHTYTPAVSQSIVKSLYYHIVLINYVYDGFNGAEKQFFFSTGLSGFIFF